MVEVLFAAPVINLSNDFLPGRRREATGPHRYIARPFVMPRAHQVNSWSSLR